MRGEILSALRMRERNRPRVRSRSHNRYSRKTLGELHQRSGHERRVHVEAADFSDDHVLDAHGNREQRYHHEKFAGRLRRNVGFEMAPNSRRDEDADQQHLETDRRRKRDLDFAPLLRFVDERPQHQAEDERQNRPSVPHDAGQVQLRYLTRHPDRVAGHVRGVQPVERDEADQIDEARCPRHQERENDLLQRSQRPDRVAQSALPRRSPYHRRAIVAEGI